MHHPTHDSYKRRGETFPAEATEISSNIKSPHSKLIEKVVGLLNHVQSQTFLVGVQLGHSEK